MPLMERPITALCPQAELMLAQLIFPLFMIDYRTWTVRTWKHSRPKSTNVCANGRIERQHAA